jgi:sec-independent protein translocase protein TatA
MLEGLFQPMHLLVILFIALMVFGPKKLPELGKGLGDGIRSFRDSMKDEKSKPTARAASKAGLNLCPSRIKATGRPNTRPTIAHFRLFVLSLAPVGLWLDGRLL